jgi:hypothetical protein
MFLDFGFWLPARDLFNKAPRNHQGLDDQFILPPANLNQPRPIVCRERLGGLLRFYHGEAV